MRDWKRREFIKKAVVGGAGIYGLSSLSPFSSIGSRLVSSVFAAEAEGSGKPKIVFARPEKLTNVNGKANAKLIESVLNDALMKITLARSPENAWGRLFTRDDIVGIKINALAGKAFSPHTELVNSIVNGVRLAGVKEGNIIIFDRQNKELVRAGYNLRTDKNGLKCIGTDGISGGGYDRRPVISGSVGSCFSKIVSSHVTALINVPVLKDHDLSGVSVGMKNFYGVIHNPNKYHDNNCDPYIAELNAHPYIRQKLRLVVCDAIKAQYNGGPAFKPQWVWDCGGILVGADPVAVDLIGCEIVEAKRKDAGMPELKLVGREPKYIETAAAMGLGVADRERIELIET